MKNILDDEKTFEAYATIDLCYYGLQRLSEEIGQPKSRLETLIDKSTGFDKAKMKEWIERSIQLLEHIIEAKKVIEADYSNDSKMLDEIRLLA